MSETTATLMSPLGRAVTLLAFAVIWIVVAVLLWRTTVPSLDLEGFDEHRYFSARSLERAHDYSQGERLIWLLSTIATLVALLVLVRRMPGYANRLGLGRIGSAIVIGMLMLVTLWFVSLPFGLASLWWQHHWGLGPFNVLAWIVAQRYALGASVAFVMLTIVVVVGLATRLGRRWWIAATPFFIVLAALFSFLSGWLMSAGTHSIRNPQLRADTAKLERRVGVTGTPVRVQKVSDWTDQANAFAVGFGPSTNVVLWDTLLDGRFSRREVNAVVAHELGHVKRRHIVKGLLWFTLFALPGAFLVAELTRRRGGMEDPGNLPYALLVLTVIGLLAAPFENVVSRRYEAEADWISLNTTRDPAATERLFKRFERTSLAEPNPPPWDYLWLENHPTLMQRIAMAERYRERSR
jgi:Zn-dependent protease with chaperone function